MGEPWTPIYQRTMLARCLLLILELCIFSCLVILAVLIGMGAIWRTGAWGWADVLVVAVGLVSAACAILWLLDLIWPLQLVVGSIEAITREEGSDGPPDWFVTAAGRRFEIPGGVAGMLREGETVRLTCTRFLSRVRRIDR